MANEEKFDIEKEILKVLNDSIFGMSITEIAKSIITGIDNKGVNKYLNRMTAAKYLEVMRAKDLVDVKKVGTSKLWILRDRPMDQRMTFIMEYFQTYHAAINEFLGDKKFEVSRHIGIRIGDSIFEKHFPKRKLKSLNFPALIEFCASIMNNVYPIPSQIYSKIHDENTAEVVIEPCLCQGIQENKSMCEMQTGIVIGISQNIFKKVTVEEKGCMCDGENYCSYLIQYTP